MENGREARLDEDFLGDTNVGGSIRLYGDRDVRFLDKALTRLLGRERPAGADKVEAGDVGTVGVKVVLASKGDEKGLLTLESVLMFKLKLNFDFFISDPSLDLLFFGEKASGSTFSESSSESSKAGACARLIPVVGVLIFLLGALEISISVIAKGK